MVVSKTHKKSAIVIRASPRRVGQDEMYKFESLRIFSDGFYADPCTPKKFLYSKGAFRREVVTKNCLNQNENVLEYLDQIHNYQLLRPLRRVEKIQ